VQGFNRDQKMRLEIKEFAFVFQQARQDLAQGSPLDTKEDQINDFSLTDVRFTLSDFFYRSSTF